VGLNTSAIPVAVTPAACRSKPSHKAARKQQTTVAVAVFTTRLVGAPSRLSRFEFGREFGRRLLAGLVLVELALAAVLLSAAATVTGGLRQLETRDVGFPTADLLTWHLELGAPRFQSAAAHLALVDRIESRIARLAGPTGVGMSTVNPLCCGDWGSRVAVDGEPVTTFTANVVNWRLVTPGFFRALGVPLLAGRPFDAHDTPTSEPVAIVDARFARRYWPGSPAAALGKRIKRGSTDAPYPWMRIVGVAGTVEDAGDYTETWYVPYLQEPAASSTDDLHIWFRSADVAVASAAVRAAMRDIDPTLPVIDLRTMEDAKQTALAQRRQGDRKHRQPVQQVLAQAAVAYRLHR